MRWLVNGALLGFGVVVALGLGEAALRILAPEAPELFEPHPILGAFHIPGARAIWTREGTALVEINAAGLRDRHVSVTKPAEAIRVLVLGDSIVEALQVPLEATFVKVLERSLGRWRLDHRVEVINGGVSGFGTAQEYLFLTHYGLAYRPDLVVLSFTVGNDVRNNSKKLERSPLSTPFFTVRDGRLVRSARPFYHETFWKRVLRRDSHLYLFLMRRRAVVEQGLRRWTSDETIPADLNVYSAAAGAAWDEAWAITERLLGEIASAGRAARARLVVVAVPDPPQVYPETLRNILRGRPVPAGWDLDLPQKRLQEIAARMDVPFVDLLPCFRAAARTRQDPLYFGFNGHLTEEGHRVVAAVLLQAIQGRRLLPSGRTPPAPERAPLPDACRAA